MKNHRNDESISHGLRFNGLTIDEETEFVRFEVTTFFFHFSFRRKTGYYIKDYHPVALLRILFMAYSLVFGWWALLMGPINKPKTLSAILNGVKFQPLK